MANKISVIIDVAVDKGVASLKNFRTAISDADGAAGKMKAGFGAAKDAIVDNAANIALSAGTALVAFGVKAVTAFQDVALAAGKFSDATGLAVEDASRWIEVAGDIGVSSDEVEAALGKMNKTLGASPALFEKLGVEVAKTKDGNTDVNATFLNVIDRLNGISDPAEKARVATQLLGKGWQGMAELIAQGSGKLKASLASVQDGKVINAAELEKARDLRAKLDDLSDSIENVALKIGGDLAPAVADVVGAISDATGVIADLNDKTKELTGIPLTEWATGGAKSISDLVAAAKDDSWTSSIYKGTRGFLEMIPIVGSLAKKIMPDYVVQTLDTADATEHAKEITEAQAGMLGELRQETADATQATDDLKVAYDTLTGSWKDQSDWLNVLDALDQFKWKMAEGKMSTREQEQATLDLKQRLAEYIAKTEEIPPEKKTQLLADINKGSWDYVESYINQVVRSRSVNIGGIVVGAPGRNEEHQVGGKASGGPVMPGTTYLVGERGPELLTMGAQGGNITPNSALGSGGVNVTINMPPGTDGADVVKAIQQYEKRNGATWRS